jgi:hypothetical protein
MKKNFPTPIQVNRQKKSRFTSTRIIALLAMLILPIGIGTAVFSQSEQDSKPRGKKYVATKEIIFDEASGKLRKPTAEETQAMVDHVNTLTNRSSEGRTVNTHPNGMKSMNVEGGFSGVVLGRAKSDGTTEVRCVFSMEEAAEFLGLEEVTAQDQ